GVITNKGAASTAADRRWAFSGVKIDGADRCPLSPHKRRKSGHFLTAAPCHFRTCAPQQRAILRSIISSAKQTFQSVEHGFSVRPWPSGNFVFALPHASSNCVWVKFLVPLRSALLRLAFLSLAPIRSALLSLAPPLKLASRRLVGK